MKIAIDGPAGAGKSTVAKMLAQKLGFIYIDTGAMYRALTWKALRLGIELDNTQSLADLAKSTKIHFENEVDQQYIYCDKENVTEEIRRPEVSLHVSKLASLVTIREILVKEQQKMAEYSSVVMDGRDVGECVLPDATYKFFVTASLEERANRRIEELKIQGYHITYDKVKSDIAQRDDSDAKRQVGSLKVLEDSIIIDTTGKSIKEVFNILLSYIDQESR
ncbi:MAG TPA: (d)CMP kinase [Syntrophomonadaceae bacterium]|nr:(d)CMP kinase [Syntrophomonadaceae bacterium]